MIEIYRRNNYSAEVTYLDDSNNVIDLTGYVVKFIVKKENDISNVDTYAVINKSFLIDDGTQGTFTIELTKEETNILAGSYNFEVQLTKEQDLITLYQDKLVIKDTYINE